MGERNPASRGEAHSKTAVTIMVASRGIAPAYHYIVHDSCTPWESALINMETGMCQHRRYSNIVAGVVASHHGDKARLLSSPARFE